MIDKNKLCIGDYALTSAMHPFALAERAKIAGWRHTFDRKIATHAAIVYSIDGSEDPACLFLAEMVIPRIRRASFEEYELNGWFAGGKIIMIRRNPLYASPDTRKRLNDRIRYDIERGVEYDEKGLLEYMWPKIEDRPDEFYCSEYLRHQAQLDGGDIIHPKWRKEDDIPPYGVQTATNCETTWSKF